MLLRVLGAGVGGYKLSVRGRPAFTTALVLHELELLMLLGLLVLFHQASQEILVVTRGLWHVWGAG